jgi:hypothetical protein
MALKASGWLITSACWGAGKRHDFETMPKPNSLGKLNERALRKAIDKNFTLDFCLRDDTYVDALADGIAKARAKSAGKTKARR